MKQAASEDLNKAVYTWFLQKRCQGFPVSGIANNYGNDVA